MAREKLKENLLNKGWKKEEVEKAMSTMSSQTEHSMEVELHMNRFIYWAALVVAVIGNLMLSVVLIPFLLVMTPFALYVTVVIIAIVFGLLFNLLINDIEELDYKHHIIAGIFIPFIALFNIYMIVTLSNKVNALVDLTPLKQNPLPVGIVYVAAFMAPYVISKIAEEIRKEKK